MLNKFIDTELLHVGTWSLTAGQCIGMLFIILFIWLAWKVTKAVWRVRFYTKYHIELPQRQRFERYLRQLIVLLGLFASVRTLHLDPLFYDNETIKLRFSLFILAIVILVVANIADWTLSNVLTHSYRREHSAAGTNISMTREEVVGIATRTVRYIVIVMSVILLLRNFNLDFSLYQQELKDGVQFDFKITKILVVILILLCARLISWLLTNVALYSVYRQRDIDEGSQFAINQICKYIIYLIAIFVSLNNLGINMTLLLGGTAALLVGVGLGLQQTFNDFFSGLVLLFERSVAVGDILTVDGVQGTVKKIGMRSSIIETLGNRNIIIPNSRLVNDNVLNWNHYDDTVRFDVPVGVAYGSDTALVKQLLLQSVSEHPDILDFPKPFVRFTNFGDSSLDFVLYFFSDKLLFQEDVRSDVRFEIDRLFREYSIAIPFPQRDVWLRKDS